MKKRGATHFNRMHRIIGFLVVSGLSFVVIWGCTGESDDEFDSVITCADAAQLSVGPQGMASVDIFSCPSGIGDFSQIWFALPRGGQLPSAFEELWSMAYALLDESQIIPCATDSESAPCAHANYVDANGCSFAYSVESGWEQTRTLHITSPKGLYSWTELNVTIRYAYSDVGGSVYVFETRVADADWTGVVRTDWPADYAMHLRTEISGNGTSAVGQQSVWSHDMCAIVTSVESVWEVSDVTPGKSVFAATGFRAQGAIARQCDRKGAQFNIIRVSSGGDCIGLFRSDSLERLGPC